MIDRTSLGTFERATDDNVDTIKAKELQDGSILVTHRWDFDGRLMVERQTTKTRDAWLLQRRYLLDGGYARRAPKGHTP
jgi:hypothetical protein